MKYEDFHKEHGSVGRLSTTRQEAVSALLTFKQLNTIRLCLGFVRGESHGEFADDITDALNALPTIRPVD